MSYRTSPSFAVGGVPERPRYRYFAFGGPCRYDPKLDTFGDPRCGLNDKTREDCRARFETGPFRGFPGE